MNGLSQKKRILHFQVFTQFYIMKVTKSFCKDEKEFISSSSSFIADKINEYIQNKGKCIIGLSGGFFLKFH